MVDGPRTGELMSGLLKTLFGRKEDEKSEAAGADAHEAAATGSGFSDAVDDVDFVATGSGAEPIHVTDETFDTVINSSVPVLVDFWAPWCGPCRMVAPVVENLARAYDGRALMAKVNTDENVQVASKLGIMGIPTLILFKDGQEIDRVVGYAPQRVLEEKLNATLN
jgi:thioredoxin 1